MSSKRTVSVEEKKNRRITGAINYYLEVEGYSKTEFAKVLGVSLSTLYNRMQNPETFSIKEVRRLAKLFSLTEKELIAMI